jgi:hypothetical protein
MSIAGCHNEHSKIKDNEPKINSAIESGFDIYPSTINYCCFQNADSTWGFTIFIDGRPVHYHRRIPVKDAVTGFKTKNDAEKVAGLFVERIKKGEKNPGITIDSLKVMEVIVDY